MITHRSTTGLCSHYSRSSTLVGNVGSSRQVHRFWFVIQLPRETWSKTIRRNVLDMRQLSIYVCENHGTYSNNIYNPWKVRYSGRRENSYKTIIFLYDWCRVKRKSLFKRRFFYGRWSYTQNTGIKMKICIKIVFSKINVVVFRVSGWNALCGFVWGKEGCSRFETKYSSLRVQLS